MIQYIYWLLGYKIKSDIFCVNSFAITDREFNYVIEVFSNDDDKPGKNLYDRVIYNH
jgi:hypothetical protein